MNAIVQVPGRALTFEQVYARTIVLVRTRVRKLGFAHDVRDDIVQDVFLAAFRKLRSYMGECDVEAWVLGILNLVIKNYRRTWRRKGAAFAVSSVVSDPETLADSRRETAAEARGQEARRVLQEVLGMLDRKTATVFVLAELEGMSAPEVAAATSLNVSTVYSRCRTARREFDRAVGQWKRRPRWSSLLE
jgi:RNA polymerase sigma-70 factor (ECF subfamily)